MQYGRWQFGDLLDLGIRERVHGLRLTALVEFGATNLYRPARLDRDNVGAVGIARRKMPHGAGPRGARLQVRVGQLRR